MRGSATRARRELVAACALTALGGAVMLLAAGRTWAAAAISSPPLPVRQIAVTGADLNSAVRALALVALAGVAAVVALPGRWRVLGGGLLVAIGIAAVWAFGLSSPDGVRQAGPVAAQRDAGAAVAVSARTGWPYGYLAGGLVVAAAGAMTAARGRRWPGLGARYATPAATARPADPWAALDRGEDPTVD